MKPNQPQTIREYWKRLTGSAPSVSQKLSLLLEEIEWRKEQKDIFDRLSAEEKDVVTLMAQSMSDEQMANELHLSLAEIGKTRKSICTKTKICTNQEATRWALAFDLI